MWIKREIEQVLAGLAASRPAVIVTGCRQAGKTSLLRRSFPKTEYVTLDLPLVAEQAERAGQQFLADHRPPIILDEIQYAPVLLRYIKVDIDRHRNESGRFLLTGSQKFQSMQNVSESLAGRVSVLDLHTLSVRELEAWSRKQADPSRLSEWIVAGGYPELHAGDLEPERFYSDYLATYLERDVRSVLNVRSLRDFDRFLRLCAARGGQMLSMNQMATDVGVSTNTIKSWLSVLEASGVVRLLEPYYENLGKRIVKSAKLYFLDTGLACFLAGIRTVEDLKRSPLIGPMFETHVLGQIIRHFANRGRRDAVYFYRDHYGHEVDFVIPRAGKFQLIECKWGEMPSNRHSGMEDFEKTVGLDRVAAKIIVTPVRGRRPIGRGLEAADSVNLSFLE